MTQQELVFAILIKEALDRRFEKRAFGEVPPPQPQQGAPAPQQPGLLRRGVNAVGRGLATAGKIGLGVAAAGAGAYGAHRAMGGAPGMAAFQGAAKGVGNQISEGAQGLMSKLRGAGGTAPAPAGGAPAAPGGAPAGAPATPPAAQPTPAPARAPRPEARPRPAPPQQAAPPPQAAAPQGPASTAPHILGAGPAPQPAGLIQAGAQQPAPAQGGLVDMSNGRSTQTRMGNQPTGAVPAGSAHVPGRNVIHKNFSERMLPRSSFEKAASFLRRLKTRR